MTRTVSPRITTVDGTIATPYPAAANSISV
jgi:hypothetical protein